MVAVKQRRSKGEERMIKIAICDDEREHIDRVHALLQDYAADKNVLFEVHCFHSPSALSDSIESGDVCDIFILDIYMPGITGMSLAADMRSRRVDAPIVFLTSSPDFALQAFGVNATQYLIKPCQKADLYAAIDKALSEIGYMRPKGIVLRVDGEYCNIRANDILYSEADDNYQRIYLTNGEHLFVRITMNDLYDHLSEHEGFFKLGRSHIINLSYVNKFTAKQVHMSDGKIFSIPKGALSQFKTVYFAHFNEQSKG